MPEEEKFEAGEPGLPTTITSNTDTVDAEKPVNAELDDDQYPHGLKLVVLAAAALVAVFLIALDQVSKLIMPTV